MIIVGFCRVLNPYNSEEENCYQVGYVTGKDGRDAIWIKYHELNWIPEDVSVGVFAGRKESEQCYSSIINASGKVLDFFFTNPAFELPLNYYSTTISP